MPPLFLCEMIVFEAERIVQRFNGCIKICRNSPSQKILSHMVVSISKKTKAVHLRPSFFANLNLAKAISS